MGPEEIEFIIMPDGTVKEEVRGIKGTGCEAVTQSVEDALGEVTEREHKPEYYEQVHNTDSETVSAGSS
jgi:threonine dehydratase